MSHCRAVCPRRGIFPLVLACLLLFSALPRLSEAQAPDHLLISEVVYDPPGAEPDGEWVELFNPTAAAVSLAGWLLKDGNAQDALPDHTIPPGGYVVVATSAAAFRAAYPTYSGALLDLGSPIGNGLSNSGDALMLVDAAGVTVDALSYGTNTSVFMPPCPDVAEGHSLARVPPTRDTDTAADWIDQPVPDPGTAGSAPPATPTETVTPTATLTATPSATPSVTPTAVSVGAIVINEIMQNPQAVADTAGEWLELYNAGATAIDLNGWELRDAGADHHTIDNGGPLWLAPGGYMVLGRNADPAANGGVTLAYRYSGFTLGNAADAIILLDPAGREVDRVAYDGGPTFPNPNGASMQLVHPSLDNSIGANWRVAITPWPGSAGDRPRSRQPHRPDRGLCLRGQQRQPGARRRGGGHRRRAAHPDRRAHDAHAGERLVCVLGSCARQLCRHGEPAGGLCQHDRGRAQRDGRAGAGQHGAQLRRAAASAFAYAHLDIRPWRHADRYPLRDRHRAAGHGALAARAAQRSAV